jgi:NadR type nicotinamide-nucleotide adenylyltransferase
VEERRSGGIVIGRFMPPHTGHQYLIDFARRYTADVTVFVCTLRTEPIPGELRFAWMRELFPRVRTVHITEEIPEASRSRSGAHEIWAASIRKHLRNDPEYVFASEEYGLGLARALGARFVPVDPRRSLFPISAGMIRNDPLTHWEYLPEPVRPYFVCRISIAGARRGVVPELAERFNTVYVNDYRLYREELAYDDPAISSPGELVTAQVAAEVALRRRAHKVLLQETDLLRIVTGSEDPAIRDGFAAGAYDELVEASRPDAVIVLGNTAPDYRDHMERRGWPVHELPEEAAIDEVEALVQTILSRHWKSAGN